MRARTHIFGRELKTVRPRYTEVRDKRNYKARFSRGRRLLCRYSRRALLIMTSVFSQRIIAARGRSAVRVVATVRGRYTPGGF